MSNKEQEITNRLLQLRSKYAAKLLDHLSMLEQAIHQACSQSGNGESITWAIFLAHQLRGTAGSFGFDEVSTLAADIEDALSRDQKNPSWEKSCDRLLDRLARSHKRVLHDCAVLREDFHRSTTRSQYN
jgi:HPt (histidine-containing phosphotransfer) domain-containing protein